jgi:hypothetical protein
LLFYLNEELIPPVVKVLKRFSGVHIVHKHAAVSATIKSHTEALETLLSRCVPNLLRARKYAQTASGLFFMVWVHKAQTQLEG